MAMAMTMAEAPDRQSKWSINLFGRKFMAINLITARRQGQGQESVLCVCTGSCGSFIKVASQVSRVEKGGRQYLGKVPQRTQSQFAVRIGLKIRQWEMEMKMECTHTRGAISFIDILDMGGHTQVGFPSASWRMAIMPGIRYMSLPLAQTAAISVSVIMFVI